MLPRDRGGDARVSKGAGEANIGGNLMWWTLASQSPFVDYVLILRQVFN